MRHAICTETCGIYSSDQPNTMISSAPGRGWSSMLYTNQIHWFSAKRPVVCERFGYDAS